MSVNSVRKHLKKYNLLDHLFEENTTCKTVSEAANSIGCKDEEIAKTLSFDLDGETIVIVMAGDKKIDNAALFTPISKTSFVFLFNVAKLANKIVSTE